VSFLDLEERGSRHLYRGPSSKTCTSLPSSFLLRTGPISPNIFQTHATITSATLDIEPRRLTLVIPGLYALDINLNLSDSALGRALFPPGTSPHEAERALMLKRARDLDVDGARAEWRTKERCLVIVV
jgi:hypothetical protein